MVQIRTNILNHATYSVSDGAYHGFFVFTRKNCGADFLERLYDGRITWNILDFEEFYEPQGAFYLADGSQTRTILQFLRQVQCLKVFLNQLNNLDSFVDSESSRGCGFKI
jgi:hypothetical protein